MADGNWNLKWVLGLVGFVLVVFLICMGSYNSLVSSNEAVEAQWSQVENVMQRRFDLIPNLVATVKGYAKHERETLEEVTRLRSQWGAAQSRDEKVRTSDQLEGTLNHLMVVLENYPDLKANESFLKLQDELAGTENRITVERQRYNEAVQDYNVKVRSFPSNLMASIGGFQRKDTYFKAASGADQAPKVDFN
ncbi:MAG TPA: LemA family protein [bacterium]|nr:LemA family protein [bacterium]